jgi:hypothetical protein
VYKLSDYYQWKSLSSDGACGKLRNYFVMPPCHLLVLLVAPLFFAGIKKVGTTSAVDVKFLKSLSQDYLISHSVLLACRQRVGFGDLRLQIFLRNFTQDAQEVVYAALQVEDPPCDEGSLVFRTKHRARLHQVTAVQVQGHVRGADVVLVYDMVATGETLCQTEAQCIAQGAFTVRACCTRPVLFSNAYCRLEASMLEEVVVPIPCLCGVLATSSVCAAPHLFVPLPLQQLA